MGLKHQIRTAISADFLKSFSDLPNKIQKKVREQLTTFQNHPMSPGLNFETIKNAADPTFRSIRIDQIYRAIISQSQDVYILLWVDKHEKAYEWASKKRLMVHPQTGAIELISLNPLSSSKNERMEEVASGEKSPGLFDSFSDDQLLRLGALEEFLPRIRAIVTEDDLDACAGEFPADFYHLLYALACGESYDELLSDYTQPEGAKEVDPDDFATALNNEHSLCSFRVIDDSIELQALLNAPLEQWRVFLHPRQRRLVEMKANGPVRVLGSAGTGKTVVAIHRAKWLAQKVFTAPKDRILFTTYTKNLASDIKGYLESICPPDVFRRIEVVNIDAWAMNYLKKNGYNGKLDFDCTLSKEYWNKALLLKPEGTTLSDQFFKDEWKQIIQPQNIVTLDQYYRASRIGRGRRLNRKDRKEIWRVFDAYRTSLLADNVKEYEDIYRDAQNLLAREKNAAEYKAIIIDEAQDLSLSAFRLIRQIIPNESANDLFIVGDTHQRIYGYKNSLSAANINIKGRGKKLRVNYRTTREIYRYASSILQGLSFDDLDGNEDTLDRCQSITTGETPRYLVFKDQAQEYEGIRDLLTQLQQEGVAPETICLTARTSNQIKAYIKEFESHQIPYHAITNKSSHKEKKEGIRVATMHRIKGIEFDYVIIASVCDGIIPLRAAIDSQENQLDKGLAEKQERSLLYVALTRARKGVFLTGYGKPCPFLKGVTS